MPKTGGVKKRLVLEAKGSCFCHGKRAQVLCALNQSDGCAPKILSLQRKMSNPRAAMEVLTIDEIRARYPDQWVLIGNPDINEPEINGSILSKLLGGIVLYASKDKREIGFKAKDVRGAVEKTACVFTGEIPKNRLFLL